MTKNYCLICGEYVEVGERFEHCQSEYGLFPNVPVRDKHKSSYTIMGIFAEKPDLLKNIKKLVKNYPA